MVHLCAAEAHHFPPLSSFFTGPSTFNAPSLWLSALKSSPAELELCKTRSFRSETSYTFRPSPVKGRYHAMVPTQCHTIVKNTYC